MVKRCFFGFEQGRDGHKHFFVGFDDSMTVGLRGPSNSFGHPTDELLEQLDQELRRWENEFTEGITKIVYGHYPMSFTTSTETGKRPEEVMAKNGVTAYLCGHLHATFGRRLYKRHTYVFLSLFRAICFIHPCLLLLCVC
jgi:hypothetical protein